MNAKIQHRVIHANPEQNPTNGAQKRQRQVRTSWIYAAAGIISIGSAAADTPIDTLQASDAISRWTFSAGKEYCCAQGSLASLPQGYSGKGARMSFSMAQSSRYVAAFRRVSQPDPNNTPAGISFRVKSPAGVIIRVRVRDSTGQWLNYNLARPLSALTPESWYQQGLNFSREPDNYWSGAADGKVHGPIKEIAIAAEPLRNSGTWGQQSGIVDFDEVAWIDSDVEQLDPWEAGVLAPGAQDLPKRRGIVTEVWDDDHSIQARLAGISEISGILQYWKDAETIPGMYDFHFTDDRIDWVTGNGLSPWFRIQNGNPIYSANSDHNYPPTSSEDIQAFSNYARALASRYAGRGINYSVWNEPNLIGTWKPSPNAGQYAEMLKMVVPAIQQADPLAKVCAGEIASADWKFLRDVLAVTGPLPLDAISAHAYSHGDVEAFSDNLMLFRDIIKKTYGANAPQVMWTETGYDLNWHETPGSPESFLKQASTIVRSQLTGWALGLPTHIYRFRVEGAALAGFALMNNDWTPRPAANAMTVLFDMTSGSSFKGTIPTKLRNVHVLKFENSIHVTLILWQDGGRFPWVEAEPEHAAKVALAETPVSVTDYMGNAKAVPANRVLSVTHEPLFVRFSK